MNLQAQALLGYAAREPAAHPGAPPAANPHREPAQPHQVWMWPVMARCLTLLECIPVVTVRVASLVKNPSSGSVTSQNDAWLVSHQSSAALNIPDSRRGAKQQADTAPEVAPARHALSAHNLAAAAAAAQHGPLDVGSRPQVLLATSISGFTTSSLTRMPGPMAASVGLRAACACQGQAASL